MSAEDKARATVERITARVVEQREQMTGRRPDGREMRGIEQKVRRAAQNADQRKRR